MKLPFRYGGFDLNTLNYVPAINALVGNYGPYMFLIDPVHNHFENLFQVSNYLNSSSIK